MRNSKYMKVLQLGMQNEMEYRANYWLQMAGFMLPIMTQIFLWLAVSGSSGQARVLALNFVVYYALSGIAFWVTESAGLFYTLSLVIYVASGTVFPLTIFGDVLARMFSLLPFSYTVFFPVNALTGKLTMLEAAEGIGVQWLWIVVLAAVSRRVWQAGVKRFVSVGG